MDVDNVRACRSIQPGVIITQFNTEIFDKQSAPIVAHTVVAQGYRRVANTKVSTRLTSSVVVRYSRRK